MLENLKEKVCRANQELVANGLVTLTFGNVSGRDFNTDLVAIKPSGVAYDDLSPSDIVLLNLDGNVVEGTLQPSSDTPTHLVLYQAFPTIGGIAHTHSTHATIFAQAMRGIPCLGTTHADYFHGEIPVTRSLEQEEVECYYEANTGHVIVEAFANRDPDQMPGVLVASHAPFTWGRSASESVRNSIALEEVARTTLGVFGLNPDACSVPEYLLDKHYLRKHGPDAYYGQR